MTPQPHTSRSKLAPHVWALEEIKALPEFGETESAGWFYGLTEVAHRGDAAVVIATVYPGVGWTVGVPEPEDAIGWQQVIRDIQHYSPALFEQRKADRG